MIDVSLFDGIKDRVGDNSSMYADLSAEDYFITQLLARRDARSPADQRCSSWRLFPSYSLLMLVRTLFLETDSYVTGATFLYSQQDEQAVLDDYEEREYYRETCCWQ